MKSLTTFAAVLISLCLSNFAQAQWFDEPESSPTPSIDFYQSRYPLKDVFSKLVDNQGNGYTPLYGTRNVRAVLNGVVYRGGANNAYNIHGKRSNTNPLPNEGLTNLCKEGFKTAVYLYADHYSTAPKTTSCTSMFGEKNQLQYLDAPPFASTANDYTVLKLVYDRLTSTTDSSPIYVHCWNGWHASGFISALILRQYCDLTGDQAVTYWNKNIDGHDQASFETIRKKIRAFKPYSEFAIGGALKNQICPRNLN